MNINYKQPQFELFPANSATLEDVNKPRFLLANLTLSIESLVILLILGIMLALFAFSIGVERGKQLTAQVLDERISAAWNLAPRKPMMAVVKPAGAVVKTPAMVVTSNAKPKLKAGNAGFVTPAQTKAVVKGVVPALQTGHFTVQVSSNNIEANARREALDLQAKGFKSFLIKKANLWLVCVGQYPTKESAKTLLKKVPAKYQGLSVRRF